MKTEVRCNDCGKSWLVEESTGGGDMVCPACLARIALPVAGAAARAVAGAAEARAAVASAVVAPPEEVVCPRCKLHFAPRSRPRPAERRKTILVIEDQEYFREVAADSLAPAYEVKTARNADEARGALAGGGIDLIVLDLTLDDDEAGRQFLRDLRPKPCPVLIFTARDESEMYGDRWEELVELGADDLVLKGMQVGESLAQKVATLLGDPVQEQA